MPTITIYEDGKEMPTERVAILGMETTILNDNEQVMFIPKKPLTDHEREELLQACSKFSTGKARFLLLPHGTKITIFRKEEEPCKSKED